MVLAACAGGDGGTGGEAGGGGEITADNLYALPEGFSDHIIFEAGPVSPGVTAYRPYDAMKEAIEELSNGQMTVEFSNGYALHGATEVTQAVRDGVAKIGPLSASYEPSGWDNWVWYTTMMDGPVTTTRPVLSDLAAVASSLEQSFNDPYLPAEFERQGVVPLIPRFLLHANYHLLCKDKVTSLAEAQGKLVRTAGPNWVSEAEAIGMTPVALPPAEQFEGLQRGVVDCVMGPVRDWNLFDLFSVAENLTIDDEASFVGFPSAMAGNKAWWDGLPPGAQNIIHRAMFEYVAEMAISRSVMDIESLKRVAADGTQVIRQMDDDLRQALFDFQESKLEVALQSPPPNTDPAVLEAEVQVMKDSFEEWTAWLEEQPEIGGEFPQTWSDFVAFSAENDEVDAPAWRDRLWEEVFLPQLPNPAS